jgi:hypothetical protein
MPRHGPRRHHWRQHTDGHEQCAYCSVERIKSPHGWLLRYPIVGGWRAFKRLPPCPVCLIDFPAIHQG